jgi:hypothetical protein
LITVPRFARQSADFRTTPLYETLPAVETFRIPSFGVRFDSANTKQGPKSVFRKPLLARLRAKRREYMANLRFTQPFVESHEKVGGTKIAIVFRNLILEDQVIAECIPRKVRYEAMVLM